MKRHRERLSTEVRAIRGANAPALITRLSPIVRGWSAYYRAVVSSRAFAELGSHMWTLTFKWARHSHPNKPRRWVVDRYFGPFNKARRDRWVFGDRKSGAYLPKHAWTAIARHHLVQGRRRATTPTWPSTGPGGTSTALRPRAPTCT